MKTHFLLGVRFVGARLSLLITAALLSIVASAFSKPEGDIGQLAEVAKKERYSLVRVWDEGSESMTLAVWDAETEEVLTLKGGEGARISDFTIDEVENKASVVIDGKKLVLRDPFGSEENAKREKREPIGKRLAERQMMSSREAELSPESLGALLEGTESISRVEGGRSDGKANKVEEER